ncbi:MAG: hypothetical protein K2N71_10580 [Oscillospiraceae bacterium]|nr:hypothetical protein [Oscillospiraceae bacterium]
MSEMKGHIDGGHDEIVVVLIRHLYSNYDAFTLLITKSQGSKAVYFIVNAVLVNKLKKISPAETLKNRE